LNELRTDELGISLFCGGRWSKKL